LVYTRAMKTPYISVSGEQNGIDFDSFYRVDGYGGIAFHLLGWLAKETPVIAYDLDDDGNEVQVETGETELEANTNSVVAVMVGDDRRHTIDVGDLTPLDEEDFCRSCGQIGCGHNVYS